MEMVLNGKKRSLASHTRSCPSFWGKPSGLPYPTASGLASRLHRPEVHGCPPGALRNLVMAVCYAIQMRQLLSISSWGEAAPFPRWGDGYANEDRPASTVICPKHNHFSHFLQEVPLYVIFIKCHLQTQGHANLLRSVEQKSLIPCLFFTRVRKTAFSPARVSRGEQVLSEQFECRHSSPVINLVSC